MLTIIGLSICVYGVARLLQAAIIDLHRLLTVKGGVYLAPMLVVTFAGIVALALLAALLVAQQGPTYKGFM